MSGMHKGYSHMRRVHIPMPTFAHFALRFFPAICVWPPQHCKSGRRGRNLKSVSLRQMTYIQKRAGQQIAMEKSKTKHISAEHMQLMLITEPGMNLVVLPKLSRMLCLTKTIYSTKTGLTKNKPQNSS